MRRVLIVGAALHAAAVVEAMRLAMPEEEYLLLATEGRFNAMEKAKDMPVPYDPIPHIIVAHPLRERRAYSHETWRDAPKRQRMPPRHFRRG